MTGPEFKEMDAICCPECDNMPEDVRVLGETDLGAGIKAQTIFCDRCESIYDVVLTA